MKITLNNKEKLDYFYRSLCNTVFTGFFSGAYGIYIDYSEADYIFAKTRLVDSKRNINPCIEDVLLEMLMCGKNIVFIDTEDDNKEYHIDIKQLLKQVPKTIPDVLIDFYREEDDAASGDVLLQTVIFGEVIYA